MMRSRHCALIVEDQERVAKDLAEILATIDCDAVIARDKEEATTLLEREEPCLVLLDLSIPLTSNAMKGRPAVGVSLLQEIRSVFGKPRGDGLWLPIIVVSGHAEEVDQAVEIMKLDADDLIQKPYKEENVVRKVRAALLKSGRDSHNRCAEARSAAAGPNVVRISGLTVKNRTVVTIGNSEVQLSDRSLTVFLQLLVAHIQGEPIPLGQFGRDDQNAYKVIDRLRTSLRSAVANPTEFVINVGGRYALRRDVVLGVINTAWLATLANAQVRQLALEIERYRR
jgi:DNA-binding response OmpR family regulator